MSEQGDASSEGSGGYVPDDPRFKSLPDEAKCVWEQCTWVGEDELSNVLDLCEQRGLDPHAVPGTRTGFLRLVRDLVPSLTKDEHAELREIAKSKPTHSVATVMQILANKRLLQVVSTEEREEVYDLFPTEAEDCPWEQFEAMLARHGLRVSAEQKKALEESPGVMLHDALATFYQLKVAGAPARFPTSCLFQNKMRDTFMQHSYTKKLPRSADEECAEAIAGEELDQGRELLLMAAGEVVPAFRKLGWFNLDSAELRDTVQEIAQELERTEAGEVDFGLFLNYAEILADPDNEQLRLEEAKQVLKQAYLKKAEVRPDGSRFLAFAAMEATFKEVGVNYSPEDLLEVERISRDEGLDEGFPDIDAWWDILVQVINPGREGIAAVVGQFWDEATDGGKAATVHIRKVCDFCAELDVEPVIQVTPEDMENCKRVLGVRTQLSRADVERVCDWFVDAEHIRERSSPAARGSRRRDQAKDGARRAQRRELGDTEPEGYGMFAFVLLIVVALLCGVGYVLVYGNPFATLWQQFTGILEHDAEYAALDL